MQQNGIKQEPQNRSTEMQSNEFDNGVKGIKWSENGFFNICYWNNQMFIYANITKQNLK